MTEREQFRARYWASKPPEVQALSGMETCSAERLEKAFQLAKIGHRLDYEIDAVGLDPYQTMWLRAQHGLTWTQKFPDPPNWNLPPGITGLPGIPFNPHNPPAGAIMTSINPDDYPPFTVAAPPPVSTSVPAQPYLERAIGIERAAALPGDLSPAGTEWTEPGTGLVWVKRADPGPFGPFVYWEVRS